VVLPIVRPEASSPILTDLDRAEYLPFRAPPAATRDVSVSGNDGPCIDGAFQSGSLFGVKPDSLNCAIYARRTGDGFPITRPDVVGDRY